MKKRWIPLLALFLLLAVCTGSCGLSDVTGTAPAGGERSAAGQREACRLCPAGGDGERGALRRAPARRSPPRPVRSPVLWPPRPRLPRRRAPTDEEVLEAYRRAQEAYSWFQVSPMSFDPANSREVDGVVYYRVDYDGISSLSTLRGYLKSLFSDALVGHPAALRRHPVY